MDDDRPHCVVVGAGHAAAQLCVSLRQAKWPGRITLIGDEPVAPYHRPPLSKTQLDPNGDAAVQYIRPPEFYRDNNVELRLGSTARSIDRAAKTIELDDTTLGFDQLVLATGSLHRRPPIQGIEHPRVFSLRTAQDADRVRLTARDAQRVAIIGAGFIGLEVAASLRNAGRAVTVFEMADRVLARVTSTQVSEYFQALHRDHGVELRTSTSITAIKPREDALELIGDDGTALGEVDFIVVGAGATPNVDLARLADLDINNGVTVDEDNRTSDPDIFAIGDCCNQVNPIYQRPLRLESVQNATDQAKRVAATIAGTPTPKPTLPWFWSDQYDVKLQIAGISSDYDRCVIRGTPEPGHAFSAWYLHDSRLIAVDAVNDARSYAVGSKLIPRRASPDPAVLADEGRDLKELLTP